MTSMHERISAIQDSLKTTQQQLLVLQENFVSVTKAVDYLSVVQRVKDAVRRSLAPADEAVVISRGDDMLIDLACRASHFPQAESGGYAGYHPSDSAAAIAHLEGLQTSGVRYLIVPSTAFWWFEHYAEFGEYLQKHANLWWDEACIIVDLAAEGSTPLPHPDSPARERAAGRNGLQRIAQLRDITEGATRAVLDAILMTAEGTATPEEQAFMDRIEVLRSELRASSREIQTSLANGRSQLRLGALSETATQRSVRPVWGQLMFHLVRRLQPEGCLELGTAVGISGAYIGAALELNANGRLITVDGGPGVAAVAAENFQRLGLTRVEGRVGIFRDVLDDVLAELGAVHFSFIDGHHDEFATVEYFEQALEYMPDGSVVVFDDINWSEGMKRAWQRITEQDRARFTIDLNKLGICIVGGAEVQRTNVVVPRLDSAL